MSTRSTRPNPVPWPPLFLPYAEAALYSGMPRSAIEQAVREGTLPSAKIGSNVRIRTTDLVAWAESHVSGRKSESPTPDPGDERDGVSRAS